MIHWYYIALSQIMRKMSISQWLLACLTISTPELAPMIISLVMVIQWLKTIESNWASCAYHKTEQPWNKKHANIMQTETYPTNSNDISSKMPTSWPTFWYLSSAAALSVLWHLHASSADYFWTHDLNCFQFSRQYAWLTLRRKPEAEQTSFHPSSGRNISQFVSQIQC